MHNIVFLFLKRSFGIAVAGSYNDYQENDADSDADTDCMHVCITLRAGKPAPSVYRLAICR